MTATMIERLTGDDLTAFVKARNDDHAQQGTVLSKTQLCMDAGYIKPDGKPAFTDFYEALLEAKEINPDHSDEGDWYEGLSEERQSLYDRIEDTIGDVEQWSGEKCDEFMDELEDIGITTAYEFEDRFDSYAETYEDFVQGILDAYGCATFIDMPWVVIDLEATWERNLRHDYNVVDMNGDLFFFRQ